MISGPVLFLIYPLFFVVIFTSLDSWMWRIIWSVLFIASLFFPPANIVYPVIMIIAIPVVNKLSEINQKLGQ